MSRSLSRPCVIRDPASTPSRSYRTVWIHPRAGRFVPNFVSSESGTQRSVSDPVRVSVSIALSLSFFLFHSLSLLLSLTVTLFLSVSQCETDTMKNKLKYFKQRDFFFRKFFAQFFLREYFFYTSHGDPSKHPLLILGHRLSRF